MKELNKLVIEYRKNKDKEILEKIFKLLEWQIKDIAKKIFYNRQFLKETKQVEVYDKKKKDLITINKKIYFKLYETHQIELDDVIQELNLFILKLIQTWKRKVPFENYLNNSLSHWIPEFINKDFKNQLDNLPIYIETEKGEEEIEFEDKRKETGRSNVTIEQIMCECLTEKEKKICEMLLLQPDITEEEMANRLGTYKMNISRILKGLRKRLKKFVTK